MRRDHPRGRLRGHLFKANMKVLEGVEGVLVVEPSCRWRVQTNPGSLVQLGLIREG